MKKNMKYNAFTDRKDEIYFLIKPEIDFRFSLSSLLCTLSPVVFFHCRKQVLIFALMIALKWMQNRQTFLGTSNKRRATNETSITCLFDVFLLCVLHTFMPSVYPLLTDMKTHDKMYLKISQKAEYFSFFFALSTKFQWIPLKIAYFFDVKLSHSEGMNS